MKKCLKISFAIAGLDHPFIIDLQKKGSKLELEGTIQFVGAAKELKVIVCGLKEEVDQFVDFLHKETVKLNIADLSIEPFVKVKDYRGAFRIIE